MKYPQYAIEKLEKVNKQLEQEFSKVWGVLPKSPERDEIMWHIMSAKVKLNKIVEANKNE